jgi:predicted Zn-dependent peptidase
MTMLTASGDSEDPEAVADAILQEAKALLERGITDEELLRMKRSAMGRRIRGLDSFDSVCFRICAYYFSGFDYFRFPSIYQEVTKEQVLAFIRKAVTPERMSLSVIEPMEEEEV